MAARKDSVIVLHAYINYRQNFGQVQVRRVIHTGGLSYPYARSILQMRNIND